MDMTLLVLTLASLGVAVIMSLVSWRLIRDERARSSARVTALADEIHDPGADGDLQLREAENPALPLAAELFRVVDTAPVRSRFALAATIVLVAGTVGATAVVLGVIGRSGQPAAGGRAPVARRLAASTASERVPLELVALGHERDADGLVVRGVLRNPSNGSERAALTAVVQLFNRDGGLVTSGRAAVQAIRLAPGRETTFVVTVPGAVGVERYRVSFRSDDRVVPHVDHRS